MSPIVLTGLPEPPEHALLGWCFVCAGVYKHAVEQHPPVKERIAHALKDAAPDIVTVTKPLGIPEFVRLQPAVTMGPAVTLGGFIVPLCWTHMPAVQEAGPGAGLDTATRLPPGLIKGSG